jgi:hypothetical protein
MVAVALLAAALVSLCHAQPQAPTSENQARYYVYGAFLTHAVPEIMSQRVTLGPELERQLGIASGADRRQIYDALMSYTDGKRLAVRRASADELARYPARRDLKAPVFTVQAGDILLLVEYDMQANAIPFVGQLSVPAQPPRAAPPPVADPRAVAPPAPSKPTPPPAALVAPKPVPPVATIAPKPAAVKPPPPPAPKPQARIAPPPPQQPELRPTGPCEVKPVMSEQDLVNCRAASTVSPRVDPGQAPRPQVRTEPAQPERRSVTPCVIKPVMSEEDLIACR